MRTHTGESPVKCDKSVYNIFCISDDESRETYMNHTLERPFKCEECDYSASHVNTLSRHLRYHPRK